MTKRIGAGLIAAIAIGLAAEPLFLTGCDLKVDNGPDAGADSGTDASAPTDTIGAQCTRIYSVLCDRAINNCGEAGFTIDQCVSSNMTRCCVDKCGSPALSPATDVTSCATAIAQEDCNAVVNNTIPAECNGVPRLQ